MMSIPHSRHLRRRIRKPRLRVESLEDRVVPAIVVVPPPEAGGQLKIQGTANSDVIRVRHTGLVILVETWNSTMGEPKTIAGPFLDADVKSIVLDAGAGNDHIQLLTDSTTFPIDSPPITVYGGTGNDLINAASYQGHAKLVGGPTGDPDQDMLVGKLDDSLSEGIQARVSPRLPNNPLRQPTPSLLVPIPGSGEGDPRFGSRSNFHRGIDLIPANLTADTPVFPVAPGTVFNSGFEANGWGYFIRVRHTIEDRTFFSIYAHLAAKPDLADGTPVTTATQLGVVGKTGNPPGRKHLHLELRPLNAEGTGPDMTRTRYLVPNLDPDVSDVIFDRFRKIPNSGSASGQPLTPDQLKTPFNKGVESVLDALLPKLRALLGTDLPVLSEGLGSATDGPARVGEGFVPLPNVAPAEQPQFRALAEGSIDSNLQAWADALQESGVQVEWLSVTPDDTGDLIRVRYTKEESIPVRFALGGRTGFDYLDRNVTGGIFGAAVLGTATVRVELVYGLDLIDGVPAFYVSDQSKLEVRNFTLSQSVGGDLSIGKLADVRVDGTLAAHLSANIQLTDTGTDGDAADGRLRAGDLGGGVRGGVDGSVGLENVSFQAKVPIVGTIDWTGRFVIPIKSGTLGSPEVSLTAPNADAVLRRLVGKLGEILGGVNFLNFGGISALLNQPLPVINQTLGEKIGLGGLTGLFGSLGNISGSFPTLDLTGVRNTLKGISPGFELLPDYIGGSDTTLTLDDARDAIGKLIRGQPVRLLTFDKAGELRWGESASIFLGAVAIPPLPIVAQLSAEFEAYVFGNYRLGFGLDTTGFYLSRDTGVTLGGGVRGGLSGSVTLAGLVGLSISAGAGIRVGAGIGLNDPDPTDNGVYLDEIFRNGENLFEKLKNSARFRLFGEATGYVRGELELPWPLPDITLFDEEFRIGAFWDSAADNRVTEKNNFGQTTRRVRPLGLQPAALSLPIVSDSDGHRTLVIDGTANADQVVVSGSKSKVEVTWYGRGTGTFTDISRVRFAGGGGNDRFEVQDPETFDVPVAAGGGDGDDVLVGGRARDTLTGQAGRDEIRGGAGADSIVGDAGEDQLFGGDGNDTVTGGDGDDYLEGGGDNDILAGVDGRDVISGGFGNDLLDGGSGDDLLVGDAGSDTLRGGDGADNLAGGEGKDRLEGGADDDVATGGPGSDTLRGGAGDDRLNGGTGISLRRDPVTLALIVAPTLTDEGDWVEGGAGADRLDGAAGNDTLEGGNGDDILNGGAGLDWLFGDDILRDSSAQPLLDAHGHLQRGTATQGEDRFEIDFQTNPGAVADRIFGGNLTDSIVIVGTDLFRNPTTGELVPTTDGATGHDDIRLTQVQGETFQADWRPLGSTDVPRSVRFTIPGDVDRVVVAGLGGNDRIEISEATKFRLEVEGGTGNDTVFAGSGQDTVRGGPDDDLLFGRGGDDALHGDEGDDSIEGGAGTDAIYAGDGHDTASGGIGRDVVFGGAGNDALSAGPGLLGDLLYGEAGVDTLAGGDGVDVMDGGADDDVLTGGPLGDFLEGGGGNDTLDGGDGRDILLGEEGDDELRTSGADRGPNPAWGARYRELLAQENRLIDQLAAIDESKSQGGLSPAETEFLDSEQTQIENQIALVNLTQTDLLRRQEVVIEQAIGGDGNDTLFGSPFADLLSGDGGDDWIYHSAGRDAVTGGLNGPAGDVFVVRGTEGDDTVQMTYSPNSGDALVVINGEDGVVTNRLDIERFRVEALDGNDAITLSGLKQKVPFGAILIDGGDGNDVVDAAAYEGRTEQVGGGGNDTLTGGAASDILDGGTGEDILAGRAGPDTLHGGAGNDILAPGEQADLVAGDDGTDRVDYTGLGHTVVALSINRAYGPVAGADQLSSVEEVEGAITLNWDTPVILVRGTSQADEIVVRTVAVPDVEARFRFVVRPRGDVGYPKDEAHPDEIYLPPFIPLRIEVDARGGNDYVESYPQTFASRLFGGDGNDTLIGGLEADTLFGGGGTDSLVGGGGNDILIND